MATGHDRPSRDRDRAAARTACTDLISILGNRVAAALPPTLVRATRSPRKSRASTARRSCCRCSAKSNRPRSRGAPPPGPTSAPPPVAGPATPLQAAASGPPLPAGVSQSIAPPPAVFVAASVRPAAPPPRRAAAATAVGPKPSRSSRRCSATSKRGSPPRARARSRSTFRRDRRAAAPPPQSPVGPDHVAAAAAARSALGEPAAPRPAAIRPCSHRRRRSPDAMRCRPTSCPRRVSAARAQRAAAPAPEAAPAPAGLAAYRDPVALVRALGLPNTPTNVAAARLALDTPQRLPAALATLESALPQSDDPRVATLRTITAFIGKIDPRSPQLASQISSFIDNVVTGNESKLVQLLTAQLIADQPAAAAPPAPRRAQGGDRSGRKRRTARAHVSNACARATRRTRRRARRRSQNAAALDHQRAAGRRRRGRSGSGGRDRPHRRDVDAAQRGAIDERIAANDGVHDSDVAGFGLRPGAHRDRSRRAR